MLSWYFSYTIQTHSQPFLLLSKYYPESFQVFCQYFPDIFSVFPGTFSMSCPYIFTSLPFELGVATYSLPSHYPNDLVVKKHFSIVIFLSV